MLSDEQDAKDVYFGIFKLLRIDSVSELAWNNQTQKDREDWVRTVTVIRSDERAKVAQEIRSGLETTMFKVITSEHATLLTVIKPANVFYDQWQDFWQQYEVKV